MPQQLESSPSPGSPSALGLLGGTTSRVFELLLRSEQPRTGRQVARELQVSPMSATKALASLETRGAVRRRAAGRAYEWELVRDDPRVAQLIRALEDADAAGASSDAVDRPAEPAPLTRPWPPTSVVTRLEPRSEVLAPVIGTRAGRPYRLDLKEYARGGSGPHVLVTGSTGTGKSTLIRSIVIDLAMTHSPQVLTVLLANFYRPQEYADLARLPHVAGLATGESGVRQLLDGLRQVITTRQARLAEAERRDIYEYWSTMSADDLPEPMPAVLLVIDEPPPEQPGAGWDEDLLTIARVGRSVGIHLVYATQSPGNVPPGIEASFTTRIAFSLPEWASGTWPAAKAMDTRLLARLPRGRAVVRSGDGSGEVDIHPGPEPAGGLATLIGAITEYWSASGAPQLWPSALPATPEISSRSGSARPAAVPLSREPLDTGAGSVVTARPDALSRPTEEISEQPGTVPFVGRESELELLSQRLADAGNGQARAVLIGGEAGVGKSRLLRRFADTARQSGAHVLVGSCGENFGDPMPYSPLLDVLETFGREYGRRAIEVGGPAYAHLVDFFDLGSGSMSNPQQVFLAVRRMLDAIGTHAPVVLILEDLHWADPSTLDLVRHLSQAHPDGRHLLLVCSYRSRGLRRGEPLWQLLAGATFLRRTERLELQPFDRAQLQQFLAGASGAPVNPKLVDRCFEWSDGIPFYAEQLMAAGALDNPDDVELPDDIRDVVLSRLVALSPDALKVLRVAAVAGRAVSRQLLRTVSELTGVTLHEALQECFDRQMLVAGHNEDVYRFQHALLREAVYRSTVRDTQVDLHIAMAEALAADPQLSLTESSAAAEQASHWYQAGDLPRALASAVRAGGTAARTLAFQAAEVQYTRALLLWQQVPDAEDRAGLSKEQLLAAAAEATRWSGHLDQALEHLRAAIAEAVGSGNEGQLIELYERQATYLWEAGKRSDSWNAYQQAMALLQDAAASAVKARVLAGLALGHLQAGRYAEGRRLADEALTIARQVGAREEEGRALNISGLALSMLDDPAAEERLRQSLEIARSANNIQDLLRAYGNLGLVLEHAGRLREAATVSRTGLEEARQLDLATTRQGIILANNTSTALVLLGEWNEAEKIITELLLDRPAAESCYPRLTLAGIEVARGDFVQARKWLASIEDVEHGADPRFLGPLHLVRAELALAEGALDRAADEVDRGVAAVQGSENALDLLRLCAVGMRCAADRANRPKASERDRVAAATYGDHLARLAHDAVPAPPTAETVQLLALCRAERQRLHGGDTDPLWGEVAAGWAELDRPYPAAYARWRQAAAAHAHGDHDLAREVARAVHRAAQALGAAPLREQVARLAKRISLNLDDHPAPPRTRYGLTWAELEVLRYIGEGYDADRIAMARGSSKRTIESQQRNLYRKLGVQSAAQAVGKAHQVGLIY